MTKRWTLKAAATLLGLGLALGLAACGEGDAPATDPEGAGGQANAPADSGMDAAEGQAPAEAPADAEAAAPAEGAPAGEPTEIVGIIESGEDAAPPPQPSPAPVEIEGISRRLSMAEATGLVPFTLYEPTFIPEDAFTVAPIIVEPREGQESPDLPNVNSGYTIEGQSSSFAISQFPAGATDTFDIEGDPQSVTIAGVPAEQYSWNNDTRGALIWTLGDTRIVLRVADLPAETLVQIAEGMQAIP